MRALLDMGRAYYHGRNAVWRDTLNLMIALRHRRLTRAYFTYLGRVPNYLWPVAFTEKAQYRKLFDRDPRHPVFCDKLASRDYARNAAPDVGLTELYWSGTDVAAMPLEDLEPPYVIKPNNRCRSIIFVRNARDLDPEAIRRTCRDWLDAPPHGQEVGEWGYGRTTSKIMVEELLEGDQAGSTPPDYKFFVFGGRVAFIYFSTGRHGTGEGVRGYFDRNWTPLPFDRSKLGGLKELRGSQPRPANLDEMTRIAEEIAAGVDFLRVDLYSVGGRPVLGELTAYPYSGLSFPVPRGVAPDTALAHERDDALGKLWEIPAIPLHLRLWRGLVG